MSRRHFLHELQRYSAKEKKKKKDERATPQTECGNENIREYEMRYSSVGLKIER